MDCDKSCLLEVLLGRQNPCDHLIDGHGRSVCQLLAEAHVEPAHQSVGLLQADLVHRATGPVVEDHVRWRVCVALATHLILCGQIAGCVTWWWWCGDEGSSSSSVRDWRVEAEALDQSLRCAVYTVRTVRIE